jgi:hypothetical protein
MLGLRFDATWRTHGVYDPAHAARVAELVDAAGLKPATSRKGVYGFDSRPAHQAG